MPTSNPDARAAVRHLKRADPSIARIIERVGPCRLERPAKPDVFHDLTHSIVHQQLNGTAAGTIFGRFKALYPGAKFPSPEAILKTSDARLRSVGLSPQKLSYIKDLATKVKDGTVDLGSIKNWDDEEVIEHLTEVKGVGRWTAEMVLLFTLGRPDVLPVDDYAFQRGMKDSYNLRQWPKANKIKSLAEPWRPYRSYGTWYIWRSLPQ